MGFIILQILAIVCIVFVKPKWNALKQIGSILIVVLAGFSLYILALKFIAFELQPNILEKYITVLKFLHPGIVEKGSNWPVIPWLQIILFLVMLTGILSKYCWDSITESGKIQFEKWQGRLLRPLIVSPILFEAVFFLASETTPTLFLFIFAYQNGFFWQTVFHGGKKREE